MTKDKRPIEDSTTTDWGQLLDSFRNSFHPPLTQIEIYHWSQIKPPWNNLWVVPMLNSPVHVIACGRVIPAGPDRVGVPLARAMLCEDCHMITVAPNDTCAVCGSRALLNISKVLKRETQDA